MRKEFIGQHLQSDCGVTCLQNIIRFYGGHEELETLKALSGTTANGTTFLGLYQAVVELGLEAEACEMEVADLVKLNIPAILFVQPFPGCNHFIIYYGKVFEDKLNRLVIGDPAVGVELCTSKAIGQIWKSKACLILTPGKNFQTRRQTFLKKIQWAKVIVAPDLSILITATILGIAISAMGLFMALFSQRLIDEILPKKDFFKLGSGLALLLAVLSLREMINAARQYLLLEQARRLNTRVVDFFYSRLVNLKTIFFDQKKMGEFTSRLADVTRIEKTIHFISGNMIIDALIVLASFVVIAKFSFLVAIISLGVFPVFLLVILYNSRNILLLQKRVMSQYAAVDSNYISSLKAIGAIKNFGKQSLFAQINKRIYGNYQDESFVFGKLQVKIGVIGSVVSILFQVGILFLSSWLVFHNALKTGELIAILGLSGSLFRSAAGLASAIIPLSEAKVAFERMYEFIGMDTEEDIPDSKALDFRSFEARDISFRFRGRSLLLKNISFELHAGEIIGIIGPNGSGKTTLVDIIQRIMVPESGRMLLNGETDLRSVPLSSWRKTIAIVPQEVPVLNANLLENIAFDNAAEKHKEVTRFLESNGFSDFIGQLPQSYSTLLGEEGVKLSGGQKQLLGIARALYHCPRLLILDESTSFMTREMEAWVLNLLHTRKNEMPVIFVTHHTDVAALYCDRLYRLENGVMSLWKNGVGLER